MEPLTDKAYENPEALHTTATGVFTPRIVDKPWGQERLIVATPSYVMKVLVVDPDNKLSVQYHRQKEETLYFRKGHGLVTLGTSMEDIKEYPTKPGDLVHIVPYTVHTFAATNEQLLIAECSTTEIADVVRLQDKYGRVDQTHVDRPDDVPAPSNWFTKPQKDGDTTLLKEAPKYTMKVLESNKVELAGRATAYVESGEGTGGEQAFKQGDVIHVEENDTLAVTGENLVLVICTPR